ncbi:MAG: hypothetical protein E6J78_04520 [Deltaproteobacteria bacterium]|nr:MAG: hypothetical protein E6J78_04520 [Deltaproteobacteria bacterium]
MRRLSGPLCAAALLFACSKGNGSSNDKGASCQSLLDCGAGKWMCIQNSCVAACQSASECSSGLVCEEGICLKPACGNDAQCASGQVCTDGACAAPPSASQVVSCAIAPGPAVMRAGSTLQLKVVAQGASGRALHFNSFSWTASGAGATIDATGLLSATDAGDVAVTASVQGGSASCTTSVHSYGPPDSGALRITAIDIHTRQPIAGAKVVLGSGTSITPAQVTGSDGTAQFPNITGFTNVHVFAAGYSYTSFIETDGHDLLVPLTPYLSSSLRSGFTGHMCSSRSADPSCPPEGDFSQLQIPGQGVHLAFFGSGIPNSPLDLSLDTLVGPLHRVVVSLTGGSACGSDSQCPSGQVCGSGRCGTGVNLPYGLVLGVAGNFFGTQDYRVFADGGLRALWGIGGNVSAGKMSGILAPVLGGSGSVDVGALLPQLLPLLGDLQAGADVGVRAAPNATPGHAPIFTSAAIPLNTGMRLRLDPAVPDLPQVDGKYLDGALVVAGAMDYPIGFIPLGMTAGLSDKVNGANGPKVIDPNCTAAGGSDQSCATSQLPMKLAPENGGAEGSKVGVAVIAFGGLSSAFSARVVLSGRIKVLDKVDYVAPPSTGLSPSIPPFPNLPSSASVGVSRVARQLSVSGDADPAVQIYRFEVLSHARLDWNVWIPRGSHTVVLPDPSAVDAAFADPFADVAGDDGKTAGPTSRLVALELSENKTAVQLETFSSLTLDALGSSLSAFTAVQVPVGP